MSIIDEGSVFIVGAGCSAPFGVPVGGSLVDDLAKQLAKEFNKATGAPANRHPQLISSAVSTASQFPKQFTSFPISLSVYSTAKEKPHINVEKWTADLNKLIALEKRLEGQTSETIDDFIVENPDYSEITKIGIAWAIFERLYKFKQSPNRFIRKDVSARHLNQTVWHDGKSKEIEIRNWIHLLINIVRQGIREGSVTKENKVRIISFNYDPILEIVLEEQFNNTETEYGPYTDYIEILHPHGVFTDFGTEVTEPARLICSWAKKISVVNENESLLPQSVQNQRDAAQERMLQATNIYAAGFAFSKPNCDLLKLQKKPQPASGFGISKHYVIYCNYDGSLGLSEIVKKRVGIKDVFERPYFSEQALSLIHI